VIVTQHHEEWFGAKGFTCDAGRVGHAAAGDRHVDSALADGLRQVERPHPAHHDLDVGCMTVKCGDQVRCQHRRHRRCDAQFYGAGVTVGDAAHRSSGSRDVVEDDLGAPKELDSRRGHGHPSGGAGQQRCPDLAFQSSDQFTERRLAHA